MDFNKKSYNIFAIVLVVLISMIIVFSTTTLSITKSSSSAEETVVDETMFYENVTEDTKLLTFKTPQSALDNAIKIYNGSNFGFHSISTGDLDVYLGDTKVTNQKVYTERYKTINNEKFQISSSRKKDGSIGITVYNQAVYVNGNIHVRSSSNVDSNFNPSNLTDWSEMSVSNYKDTYGVLPTDINYVINKDSVLKYDSFRDNVTYYTVTVSLDPSVAGKNYVKQIKNLAGSNEDPTITKLQMVCNISKVTGAFISISYCEKYLVNSMGIEANCEMNYTEKFVEISKEVKLPDYLQQFID